MKLSVVRVSSLLVLILLFWAAMGCAAEEQTCFQLYDRENERVLLEVPVQPGDVLRLEIEHSFEHIPWFEYYTVTEDGAFLLDTIAVGGYARESRRRWTSPPASRADLCGWRGSAPGFRNSNG